MSKTPACGSNDTKWIEQEQDAVQHRMALIRHKVLILSGKGGVGKSSVAANISVGLAMKGLTTGLVDIDIHGPSIPKILGLEGSLLVQDGEALVPVGYDGFLAVMSVGFLLPDRNNALIWRAPLKHGIIKQFLGDVAWGQRDWLIVDCPPGTGDESISMAQLLKTPDGAVIVTTPQDVALEDVRKSITFCRQVGIPILGLIENMSGFACPHCATVVNIFKKGGGEALAAEMQIPFLGSIPLDAAVVDSGDSGEPVVQHEPDSPAGRAFAAIVDRLILKVSS
jgi:ATP-binding protein involved in chromosome partitioning